MSFHPDKGCIRIPPGAELIQTPTATFWFDEEGILYSVSKGIPRTLENLSETIGILRDTLQGKKAGYICDTSRIPYFSIEMRELFTATLPDLFWAVAIVHCTRMGELMGTILFKRREKIPVKTFTDLEMARQWIRETGKIM